MMTRTLTSKITLLSGLFISFIVMLGSTVKANEVELSFSGILNYAYNNRDASGPSLPGVIGDGDGQAYRGSVTFDDSAPLVYQQVGSDYYAWIIGDFIVDIGGYDYSFIRYNDNPAGQTVTVGTFDGLEVFGVNGQDGPNPSSGPFSQLSFGVAGGSGLLSSLTTLGGIIFDPSRLVSSGFTLVEVFDPEYSLDINGSITEISTLRSVPDSSHEFLMLGIGLIGLPIFGKFICKSEKLWRF